MTLGVRGRLVVAFVAVALFTGCLGAFALAAMARMNANQEVMYVDQFGGAELFSRYLDATYQVRLWVIAYLLVPDPAIRQDLRTQIVDGDAQVAAIAAQLDAADVDRVDVTALANMTTAWDAYTQWRDNVLFNPAIDHDPAAQTAAYYSKGVRLTAAIAAASDQFRALKRSTADELAVANAVTYEQTRNLAIALSVAAVLLALGIGYWLARSIVRPVRQVAQVASGLAVGALQHDLDVHSNDELGQMADAFRHMIAYQQEMAGVATAIADGNLSMDIMPKSSDDVLGTAFHRMSGNLRDMVTELHRKTATLEAQARLLDLAQDAIIVREPDTAVIHFWNDGAQEMYGWTRDEAIGRPTHDLLKTQFPESAEAIDAELARSARWDGELVHTRKDGTRVTVASRQALQRDDNGEPIAVLAINTDITQRIEAEVKLARARDAAEAASAAKTVFLANTSHEIRTPMNAILGMAELLADTPLNEEQHEYVRTLQRAGDTLLSLINDVLDLSKVEAGQLELEHIPFDLVELVEHVAEVLAVRAHAKGLELNVHVLPGVPNSLVGDPTRLRQVLINLVGNAIKFTDAGEVDLRIELDRSDDLIQYVSFSVRDTGIGIPTHKQHEIFASFVQADVSTTRRHGGTGLGLAISQRIVELMEGHLEVVSEAGHGSTFTFTIPLEVATPTEPRSPAPTVDISGWRVLIADDNATNRLILRQFLAAYGASVVEAVDGLEAIAAVRQAREQHTSFQLLLLDGRMPGMDGFEVAATLRGDADMLSETVVMLTSDRRAGDVVHARQLGLAAYLVKPVKRVELLRTISMLGTAAPSASRADSTPTEPEAHEPGQQRPVKVLLVDDSSDNRLLIQAYLQKLPYLIDTAEDGLAGVTKVRENDYDIILMDMLMPVMDGLEATRAIRAWERAEGRRPTPIVALTANAMEEDVRRSFEAGCDAHVTKPVKKAALMASIIRHTQQPEDLA